VCGRVSTIFYRDKQSEIRGWHAYAKALADKPGWEKITNEGWGVKDALKIVVFLNCIWDVVQL